MSLKILICLRILFSLEFILIPNFEKESERFASFFKYLTFLQNSFIFFTLNKLKIVLYLLYKSKSDIEFLACLKLNNKNFSNVKDTACP